MSFETALAFVLSYEGGFTDDPDDPGNWTSGDVGIGTLKGTKYGISAAAYPEMDIANLTRELCEPLYQKDYWDRCHCSELPQQIAFVLFDSAVNQGQSAAVSMLQKSLGVTSDGLIGSETIAAAFRADETNVVCEFIAQRCTRYATNKNVSLYGLGWFRRVAACHQVAMES